MRRGWWPLQRLVRFLNFRSGRPILSLIPISAPHADAAWPRPNEYTNRSAGPYPVPLYKRTTRRSKPCGCNSRPCVFCFLMDSVEEGEAREIGVHLKSRRKSHGKTRLAVCSGPINRPPSLTSTKPEPAKKALKSFKQRWLACAGDLDEAEQLKAVNQAIEVFSLLPRESQYAQHRLRLLNKVKSILEQSKYVWRVLWRRWEQLCGW